MSWLTQDKPSGVQVVPLDDLIVHKDVGCPCAPVVKRVGHTCWDEGDGKLAIRTVTVHQAMDGRS